jgi:hypothetical protein
MKDLNAEPPYCTETPKKPENLWLVMAVPVHKIFSHTTTTTTTKGIICQLDIYTTTSLTEFGAKLVGKLSVGFLQVSIYSLHPVPRRKFIMQRTPITLSNPHPDTSFQTQSQNKTHRPKPWKPNRLKNSTLCNPVLPKASHANRCRL